jgi:hypothetical protein
MTSKKMEVTPDTENIIHLENPKNKNFIMFSTIDSKDGVDSEDFQLTYARRLLAMTTAEEFYRQQENPHSVVPHAIMPLKNMPSMFHGFIKDSLELYGDDEEMLNRTYVLARTFEYDKESDSYSPVYVPFDGSTADEEEEEE